MNGFESIVSTAFSIPCLPLIFKWCSWPFSSRGTICLSSWSVCYQEEGLGKSAVSRKLAQMPICTIICKSSGSDEVSHTWWHVHTEWKKKALTDGWGKQRKEGCCPSILLQSNGSSKEIECSLASSKQWEEVLTSPWLVMVQALYLSVISKVVFV